MSSSPSGPPRRRRIAGERRGRGAPAEGATTPPGSSPSEPSPRDALAETPRKLPDASPTVHATPEEGRGAAKRPVLVEKGAGRASEPPPGISLYDDEPDTDTAEGEERTGGWWGSRVSLIVLTGILVVLLTLAALAALGLLGTDGLDDRDDAEAVARAERTAPAAAEAAAAAILAYDYKSLDADADSAVRYMTEDFAAKYTDTFEKVVRPAAEQTRAKVTATVQASAVIRATEDTARVLLFVDQATVSTANERPQIALNRVEMSMVRDGDIWLVDNITSY